MIPITKWGEILYKFEGFEKDQLFPELHDTKRIQEISSNPLHKSYLEDLHEAAEGYRREKIAVLPWHLFKGYDTTGNRTDYEGAYFDHRGRLMTFALEVWLYNRQEDIVALEDIIWAICEEYTWSLPAHLYSKSLEPASESPSHYDPETNIDLFAAETGFALAEILYMLEARLSPLVVHRAKKEVLRRVLMSYMNHPDRYNWEDMKNNWCAVCAGSIGAAAIYLIEDPGVLSRLIDRLLPTLDQFIESFETDGTCLEGLSYWTYGVSFYVAFADLLMRRTDGDGNLLQSNHFEKIAAFAHKCYFPGGWTVSFSDGNQRDSFRSGLTHYLKHLYPNIQIPPQSSAAGYLSDSCYRWCNGLRDLLWTQEQVALESVDRSETSCEILDQAEWLLCQQSRGHFYGLAFKGGHNDEPHNHNDIGSFIFYKDGECLLTDLGSGEYTKDYFGAGRYEIFCNSSLGHSVPIIDGKGQKEGRQHCAKNTVFESGCHMRTDLSGAYGNKSLVKLLRDITFREEEGILLTDTFEVTKEIQSITERLITLYEPIVNSQEVVIKGEKTSCAILYNPNLMTPSISCQSHQNHEGQNVRVYCLDFELDLTKEVHTCRLEIR